MLIASGRDDARTKNMSTNDLLRRHFISGQRGCMERCSTSTGNKGWSARVSSLHPSTSSATSARDNSSILKRYQLCWCHVTTPQTYILHFDFDCFAVSREDSRAFFLLFFNRRSWHLVIILRTTGTAYTLYRRQKTEETNKQANKSAFSINIWPKPVQHLVRWVKIG